MSAPFKIDLETAEPIGKEAPTARGVAIRPRDRRFCREDAFDRWWYDGDPIATAWHNALSLAFPHGEAFFIETLKAHRDGTPPQLEAEIRSFIQQEVNHTREHVAFNRIPRESGYDLTSLDRRMAQLLEHAGERTPIANLAATLALEHFTAINAHFQLKYPERFMKLDGEVGEMWLWHAVEEIEHKAVAYDTWLHATREWNPFKRWYVRSLLMLLVTRNFVRDRMGDMQDLMEQDGLSGRKWRRKALAFLFWSPGILRKAFPAWLAFFKPGFHPWQLDDRDLIEAFDRKGVQAVANEDIANGEIPPVARAVA